MTDERPGPEDGIVARGVDRMAHQLKNPLQAITVNLEVLRLKATKAVGPEQLEEVERLTGVVNGSVRTLDRRIDLLVALARRSEDESSRSIGLGDFVRDAAGAFRLDDREQGRGVALDLPDEADDPEVRARAGWLLAFLLRAVDLATSPQTPPLLRVRGESGGGRIELAVAFGADDDGDGASSRDGWERLAEDARRAGGELDREDGRLVLRLPGA